MKWIKGAVMLLVACFSSQLAQAQMEVQKGIEGKTWYDTAHEKINEAYEYKLRYRVKINPNTGQAEIQDNPTEIKNGLYIKYRIDGTIEVTGYFKNDVKCGPWKYMDETGRNVVREEFHGDDCVME